MLGASCDAIFTIFLLHLCTKSANCFEQCSVHFDLRVNNGICNITAPKVCNPAAICKKQFKMLHLHHKPFSPQLMEDLLRTCCGPCVNSTEVVSVGSISQVTPALMKDAHFVFPVLGRRDRWVNFVSHFDRSTSLWIPFSPKITIFDIF